MSIPTEHENARFARFGQAIRLSPILVAVILAALWLAGSPPEVPDLRFSAPVVARPGTSIGLRAWQMDRDDEGYPVVRAPGVQVELRNEAGLRIASTTLSPSSVEGVEGRLDIPSDLDGALSLIARAEISGRTVTAARTLHVRTGIDSRLPAGREVNRFQVYELGPIRVADPANAPAVLDPRVVEGACPPDLPCTLLVWVGHWEGRVRARSAAGIHVEPVAARVSGGFARIPLVVRGQEGRASVEAIDEGGSVVATREVRIPLVPGALVAHASTDDRSVYLEWEALDGRGPVLVDIFEHNRWVDARSLESDDRRLGALSPGVWRLQIRPDLFSNNTAAVAFVVVGDSEGDAPLQRAADAVVADADRDGLDPLAMSILDGSFSGRPEDALDGLFAVPRFEVVAMGPGVSSTIGVDEAQAFAQERRRWWAAGAILMLGLIVSMVLLRVELLGQARARQLLEELGDGPTLPRRTVFGRGLWAFVLLVFVLMAALALSKRWF